MTSPILPKDEYAKAVCYFLAELLRTRKITLTRSAEIAQKVVDHINLIDSEEDFLRLIKEMTSDFEELFQLTERIHMNIKVDTRKDLDGQVREFVIRTLPQDTKLALDVLLSAIQQDAKVDDLCVKFPQFKEFLTTNHNERRI
jgi:hypothetical protein